MGAPLAGAVETENVVHPVGVVHALLRILAAVGGPVVALHRAVDEVLVRVALGVHVGVAVEACARR